MHRIDERTIDQGRAVIGQRGKRIGYMDDRVGIRESRLDRMAADLTRTRGEVMAPLDRHQDLLTAIKDDMNVNIAAVDQVRDSQKQARNGYDQLEQRSEDREARA